MQWLQKVLGIPSQGGDGVWLETGDVRPPVAPREADSDTPRARAQ